MCLAIPAKIIKINKNVAEIESLGVKKEVDISLTPEAKVGNFVIVHAGFAIQIMNKEDTQVTLEYWEHYFNEEKN